MGGADVGSGIAFEFPAVSASQSSLMCILFVDYRILQQPLKRAFRHRIAVRVSILRLGRVLFSLGLRFFVACILSLPAVPLNALMRNVRDANNLVLRRLRRAICLHT